MKQVEYYNRNAHERPSIPVGQTVRVRFDDRPDWRKAEVAKVLPNRSYEVKFEDGTVRRRTSRHVHFSGEKPIIVDDEDSNGVAPSVAQPAPVSDLGHNIKKQPDRRNIPAAPSHYDTFWSYSSQAKQIQWLRLIHRNYFVYITCI